MAGGHGCSMARADSQVVDSCHRQAGICARPDPLRAIAQYRIAETR